MAADVALNGVVGTRALLAIDGGKPRWVTAGESTPEGVKLVSVAGDSVVFEVGGQRRTLKMGQSERLSASTAVNTGGGQSVALTADGGGHFVTTAQINGRSVRVLVDTGASFISMSASEAKRLNINYLAGQRSAVSTANGVVPTYKVKIDEVRLGDVMLNNVDGMVHADDSLPIVLLGMSFLNRMEMQRNGDSMVLKKRF